MRKILLLIVILLLSSQKLSATWTLKNSKSGNSGGSAVTNEAAPAFTNALTNPSIIIVVCQNTNPAAAGIGISGASTIFSVPTDTAGHTYLAPQVGVMGFGANSEMMFYTENTATTASNVVTCHSASGSYNFFSTVAFEYTGGATSGPVDQKYYNPMQTSGASGANSLVATSQTTTINGDLIVAAFGCINGPCSHGTSPNSFTEISATGGEVETFVQTTAGAIAPTAGDSSSSDSWGGIWVAFTPTGTAAKPLDNYRQDTCSTSDGTSLSNSWTLTHCQGTTSDSLNANTATTVLTVNPTVGHVLVFANEFDVAAASKLTVVDSLGNVAAGFVTTSGTAVTFSSGLPFSMSGCSAPTGGTCDWNGKSITINSVVYTISTVNSFTSITLTATAGTQSTPVAYTGPTPFCTDTFLGTSVNMSTCMANVTSTGTDTVTVTSTGTAAFTLATAISEIAYPSGSIKGLDTAACPAGNCIATNSTSNASTGVMSQSMTLTSTGELVYFIGSPVLGPVGPTASWLAAIMGLTTATSSNLYCGGGGFCMNNTNSAFKSSASSGSFTASMTDAATSDGYSSQAFAFLPNLATAIPSGKAVIF